MMKGTLRWWPRVGLLALTACGDFTLVEVEPQTQEPFLGVHVSAVGDESTRYELNAVFHHGTDARGHPTEVGDRALHVEGTRVLPYDETALGFWLYRWQETRVTTGSHADSVRLAFPILAASPRTHSVTVPVTRRVDPADVSLASGDDLLLRVSAAGGATPGLDGGADSWMLDIRPSCSSGDSPPRFMITGRGPFPAELRVPWQWLQTPAGASTSACFRAFSSFQVVGSPFRAIVNVSVQLSWRIHVAGPAT